MPQRQKALKFLRPARSTHLLGYTAMHPRSETSPACHKPSRLGGCNLPCTMHLYTSPVSVRSGERKCISRLSETAGMQHPLVASKFTSLELRCAPSRTILNTSLVREQSGRGEARWRRRCRPASSLSRCEKELIQRSLVGLLPTEAKWKPLEAPVWPRNNTK